MTNSNNPASLICPVPITRHSHILMAHGGGGKLMHELIEEVFLKTLDNPWLRSGHDSAVIETQGRLAFTTDSYVVHPLFFPGGDIGSMSVFGTVNDLAMAGALPRFLSAAFIIEEGTPIETVKSIAQSMAKAAREAHVYIVTGDTKVVEKGKADGLFINTAGIGFITHELDISPQSIRPGDAVLINGDIGRHGIAIMAQRQGLAFETTIASDSAPLAGLVENLIAVGLDIHCMRDATRGGLSSTLNELAKSSHLSIQLKEKDIPVQPSVQGACEILGLDPLYVACEGRFVIFLPADQAEKALAVLKRHPLGEGAQCIGSVHSENPGLVILESHIGGRRIVDMISGEQLPRIC
jgi:hydrogenase expression/formation protein HypE